MGQHYIPQAYLSHFCDPATPRMIQVYDKQKDEFSLAHIKQVAQSRKFYDDEVEKALAKLVELPANIVFAQLRESSKKKLTEAERLSAAVYVATMINRVPAKRAKGHAIAPGVIAGVIEEIRAAIEAASGKVAPATIEKRLAEVAELKERWEEELPDVVTSQIRDPMPSAEMVDLICSMRWQIIRVTPPTFFITSDNPAYFFEYNGVGAIDSELCLPLSPSLLLYCSWNTGPDDVRDMSFRFAQEINARFASGATRLIFSPQPIYWIRELAKLKPTDLNRIQWND